uniref:Putative ovule protein n=1 Tax=Solanum chacoense TaxID=4108 RepID=A0A0V0GTI7_SOLCH
MYVFPLPLTYPAFNALNQICSFCQVGVEFTLDGCIGCVILVVVGVELRKLTKAVFPIDTSRNVYIFYQVVGVELRKLTLQVNHPT